MSDEQAAPETKGVSAELLGTVDLGPEIEGMAGRQLRMRLVTFEPGAVYGPVHDHVDRPGIVYILQGTITDQLLAAATKLREEHPGDTVAIVVGSSSQAAHRLVGSVTVSLARRSPVPVVIVP